MGFYRAGETYRITRAPKSIHRVPDDVLAACRQAGFPRAGIVVVDDETLLVDDVADLMLTGRVGVLAEATAPPLRPPHRELAMALRKAADAANKRR